MTPDDSAAYVAAEDSTVQAVASSDYFDYKRIADLQRFVRSQCADTVLADEVVQDTLVVALTAWDKVGTFKNPMGWIIKTARNVLKRAFVRASVQRRRTLEIVVNEPFHEPMNEADAQLVLFSLMSQLSPRQSEVICLYWLGYTDPEIARLLEITPSTVQYHRENAHTRLQAMMDEGLAAHEGRPA